MIKNLTPIFLVAAFLSFFVQTPLDAQIRYAGASVSSVYTLTNKNISGLPEFPIKNISLTPEKSINFDFNIFAEYNITKEFFFGAEFGYLQSSILYKGYENIKVIIDKKPIDGTVRHVFDVNLNWLYPSLFLGYSYQVISFTIGNKFNFDVSSYYNSKQTILEPDSLYFINPTAQQNIDIKNVNKPVYMPFIRLTYDFGKQLFKTNAFTSQLDFEYAFAINSVSDGYNIKMTNIKFGLNVGFDFTKRRKEKLVIFDTLYSRDTLVSYSFNIQNEQTRLDLSSAVTRKEKSGDVDINRTYITEHYIRLIPKPRPLLNGELKTVFITSGGTEMKECVISYSQKLINRNFSFKQNNRLKYNSQVTMVKNIEIPSIRFYTSIIAEDGLDSTIIKLYSKKKLIKKIIKTDKEERYIDVKIDSLIDLNDLTPIQYELTLVDLSGQKKTVSTGEIILKSKKSNVITKNDIYYIDLKFDYSTIRNLIEIIIKKNRYNVKSGYYSTELDEKTKEIIDNITVQFDKIKFEALSPEILNEHFSVQNRNIRQDLIIHIQKQK